MGPRRLGLAALILPLLVSPAPAAAWRAGEAPFLTATTRPVVAVLPSGAVQDGVLTIVIEGDGDGHDRRGRPTKDPTPRRAVGLEIARAWPAGAAWLARPCQYAARQADPACAAADWTTARFGPDAVAAMDAAVEALKVRSGAERVRLVGWSGGGVIAWSLARRRPDVAGLATVAAPLDLAKWTGWLGASRIEGPRPEPQPGLPQVHFLGEFDPVVPAHVASPAAATIGGIHSVHVVREAHVCCWGRRTHEIAGALFDAEARISGSRRLRPGG